MSGGLKSTASLLRRTQLDLRYICIKPCRIIDCCCWRNRLGGSFISVTAYLCESNSPIAHRRKMFGVGLPGLHHASGECLWNKLRYRRDSARCENGHSMSLRVIRCCASRRGIHDFLSLLDSNLTFTFNRSWDITPIVCISIPHRSSRWNWKNTVRSRWTRFTVRVPRTLDYSTTNLNPRWHAPSQCTPVPDRQTDGRTSWQQREDSFYGALKWFQM